MRHLFTTLLLTASILSAQAQQLFTFGTDTNPQGQTIHVDGHGFVFDGHHTVPVMGEMHYARVPESDWRREIRKMRAGGVTVLSTYVFWIHHEAEEGQWNWTRYPYAAPSAGNNLDLHHFLEICCEEQMPVVLRVGPFCHGEVYQGGFPVWLAQKAIIDPANYKLRSLAPGFIEATRKFYAQIYEQAKDFLWKNGGTVIGMQIENECRGPWAYYTTLKDMAVEIGFDLPFYTRTGWPKLNGKEEFGRMLPLYGDYADGFWDRVLTDMPGNYAKAFIMQVDTRLSEVIATEALGTNQDTRMEQQDLQYPYLTCELGGGMMPAYHRRINISGREAFPLAICKLGSGSNLPGYYMYHGGSNAYYPGHSMAETQDSPVTNYNDMPLISYDFQSPLGEMGQLNETAYHQTRWLHQFLADWGEELCLLDVDTLSDHESHRGPFVFRNDYVRILHEEGSASVTLLDWNADGITLSTIDVQPFAKADGGYYFIPVNAGAQTGQIVVNGHRYTLKADKPKMIAGHRFTLLSSDRAKTAFVIDHQMHYARHGGILYKGDNGQIAEETWQPIPHLRVDVKALKSTAALRDIKTGTQKVAAMPTSADFVQAAVWELDCTQLTDINQSPSDTDAPDVNDLFLRIDYRGDVARVYADGQLVEDNFWNGKPMYVRIADLIGKKTELRILPLGKDYPIYLQSEQRAVLDQAPDGQLFELNGIEIIHRNTSTLKHLSID